jgi:hypothetical protein
MGCVGIKLYSTNINTKIINHQHELNVKEEGTNLFRVCPSFSLRTSSLKPAAVSIFALGTGMPAREKETNRRTRNAVVGWMRDQRRPS